MKSVGVLCNVGGLGRLGRGWIAFVVSLMVFVSADAFAVGGALTVTPSANSVSNDVSMVEVTLSLTTTDAALLSSGGFVLQWDARVFALDASSSLGTEGDNDPHATPYLNGLTGGERNNDNGRITQLWTPAGQDGMEIRLSDSDSSADVLFGVEGQAYINYTRTGTVFQDPDLANPITDLPMFTVTLRMKPGVMAGTSEIRASVIAVSDSVGSTPADYTQGTASILIDVPNQLPTVAINTGLTVDEGASGAFSAAMLSTTDAEGTPATQLIYTPTSPAHGTLTGLAANGTFTQDDIDQGRIEYNNNGDETASDTFDVIVSDGLDVSAPVAVTITVTPVNDPPVLATREDFTVPQGSAIGKVVNDAILSVTDADTADTITYTLTTAPTRGTLKQGDAALAVDATFTQADLDGGTVVYLPLADAVQDEADSFSVSAVDSGGGAALTATVNVTIGSPFGFEVGALTLLGSGGDSYVLTVSNGSDATTWTQSNAAAGTLSATTGAVATYTANPLVAGAGAVTDEITVRDAGGLGPEMVTVTIYSPIATDVTDTRGVVVGSEDPLFAVGMPAGGSGAYACAVNGTGGVADVDVDSGCGVTISPDATGTFTVTVTDTARYHGAQSAAAGNVLTTADVEVVSPVVVSSDATVYLENNGESAGNATITAEGGKGAYTYTTSDSAVVTVDAEGVMTAQGVGEATLTVVDVTYTNLTATVTAVVAGPLTLRDTLGNDIAATPQLASDGTYTVAVGGGYGSAQQTVSVTAPDGTSQTLEGVDGHYTFTAPTTGAFAGVYTLTVADAHLGETANRTVKVYVPLQLELSNSSLLEMGAPAGTVTVLGAADDDVIVFEVLDRTGGVVTDEGAVATVAQAVTVAHIAQSDIITSDVETLTTIALKATNQTRAAVDAEGDVTNGQYTQVTSGTLMIVPLASYAFTVVDAGGAALEGVVVSMTRLNGEVVASAPTAIDVDTGDAVATLSLTPALYSFDVTPADSTQYQPTRVTLEAGSTTATVRLTTIADPVIYRGQVTWAAGFAPDSMSVHAIDVDGRRIPGLFEGQSYSVVVDAAFTPVRFNVTAPGATMVSRVAPERVAHCSDPLQESQAACEGADPAGVWQVMGAVADVLLSPLSEPPEEGDVADALRSDAVDPGLAQTSGDARAVAVGEASQGFANVDPSFSVASGVRLAIPVNTFRSEEVGDIFASLRAVKISEEDVAGGRAFSSALRKALLTDGEIIEIHLAVSSGVDGSLLPTAQENDLIQTAIPVEVPVNVDLLLAAVGTEDVARINDRLVVYTAPTIQNFLDGEEVTTVRDATFDPMTGRVTANMPHFSVVVPGVVATVSDRDEDDDDEDESCFIATAAYGSYQAPYVRVLRQFRDQILLTNTVGSWFVTQYYTYSPPIADWLRAHDGWRAVVRVALLPLIAFSWFLVQASVMTQILALCVLTLLPVGLLAWRRRAAQRVRT